MSSATPQEDSSSYDDELVDNWSQQEASETPNGPLRPKLGNPIPNNASYELP